MTAVSLDESQKRVVSVDHDVRQVVLAGPGAGKSQVVGELARRLVSQERLYPDEILIISFSRAAVDVVRSRTADVVEEGEAVRVQTIDSLAGQIITAANEDFEFSGYDAAVERATSLLRAEPENLGLEVQHLVIDEFQDLVGLRAELVMALLDHCVAAGAGFTLLGDPMQGLYDFQLTPKHPTGVHDLVRFAVADLRAEVHELTGEYRSQTADARLAVHARPRLMGMVAREQVVELQGLVSQLVPLGELDEDAARTIGSWSGSTALLCDTNIRATFVADSLQSFGLRAETAGPLSDHALPAWLGQVFGADDPGLVLTFDDLTRRLETARVADVEDTARALMALADSPRGLTVRDLAQALVSQAGRRRLQRVADEGLLVSTVHRAKGLEFDNVVLVDPDDWERRNDGAADEAVARMLFVALSRGRRRVSVVRGLPTRGWYKRRMAHGDSIWVQSPPGRQGLVGLVMEPRLARDLGPSDADLSFAVGQKVE